MTSVLFFYIACVYLHKKQIDLLIEKNEVMNVKVILDFLIALKHNNNRDWFHENKSLYEAARSEFESIVNHLIPDISNFDKSIGLLTAKECVFRIYRDIRFSKDKIPYKSHFGAFIAPGGRKSVKAGYYLHLEDGMSVLGGGIYRPPSDILKALRQEIYYNFDEFSSIINAKDFNKYFKEINDDDKLKKPPKDFPPDFKGIDLLKNKSYTIIHHLSNENVLGSHFGGYILEIFSAMFPFNAFLTRGME